MILADANTVPRGKRGLLLAWTSNLLVTGLCLASFWWLANRALEHNLLLQTAQDQQQLDNGWRWEFDYRSDLVGRAATGLKDIGLEQSQLSGYRGPGSGFISLNFRGRRLDASIHHILQIRIWLQHPAPLGIFHSEILGGPVISTPAIALQAGWQLIELDLAQQSWQANTYREQKRVSGPRPSSWGGEHRIVSSLRLHPSMRKDNQFKIDWIRLVSSQPEPWSLRPRVELTDLGTKQSYDELDSLRAPVLLLPAAIDTAERILDFRDQLNRTHVSASLLPNSAGGLHEPTIVEARWSGPRLAFTWLTGLIALLATIANKPRMSIQSVATLQLAGLLLLTACLLTWPDREMLDDSFLALTLGLLVSLVLALLWQTRRSLPGNLKLTSSASAETAILITACIVPLFILSLVNGHFSQPTLIELLPRFGRYLVWASLQQVVLCIILLGIMQRLRFRPTAALLTAAMLFGLAHSPNFALMVITLILARLCLWLYHRHDSLLPGIALHAVLGTLYLELLPTALLRSGAIGMRFFF